MVSAVSTHSPSSDSSAGELDSRRYLPHNPHTDGQTGSSPHFQLRGGYPIKAKNELVYHYPQQPQPQQPVVVYTYRSLPQQQQQQPCPAVSEASSAVEITSPSSPDQEEMDYDEQRYESIGEPPPLIKIKESPSDGSDEKSMSSDSSGHAYGPHCYSQGSSSAHGPQHEQQQQQQQQRAVPAIPPPHYLTMVNPLVNVSAQVQHEQALPPPVAAGGQPAMFRYSFMPTAARPMESSNPVCIASPTGTVPLQAHPIPHTGQVFTVPYSYYTAGVVPRAPAVIPADCATSSSGHGSAWTGMKASAASIQYLLPQHNTATAAQTSPTAAHVHTPMAAAAGCIGGVQHLGRESRAPTSARQDSMRVVHLAPSDRKPSLPSLPSLPYPSARRSSFHHQQPQQQKMELSPSAEHRNAATYYYYPSAVEPGQGAECTASPDHHHHHQQQQQPANPVPYYRLQGPYTVDDGVEDYLAHARQDQVSRDPARITASVSSSGGHEGESSPDDDDDDDESGGGEKQTHVLYWCSQCHFTFRWRRHLEHHFAAHRTPERPNLCHLCGRCFTRGDHLNRHASMHFMARLPCQLCGELFQRASHLELHWTNAHAAYLSSVCLPAAHCAPKSYSAPRSSAVAAASSSGGHASAIAATQRVADRHGEDGTAGVSDGSNHNHASDDAATFTDEELTPGEEAAVRLAMTPVLTGDSRPFRCSTCARAFSRLAHLQRHQNVHSGDKPFRCSLCGRTYHSSDKLKAHVVMMHDSHLISCSTCKKEFSTMGALTNHQKVHIRERMNSTAA